MRKLLWLAMAVVLVNTAVGEISKQSQCEENYVKGEILVKFKENIASKIRGKKLYGEQLSNYEISSSINALNKKYKTKKYEQLINNAEARLKPFKLINKHNSQLSDSEKIKVKNLKHMSGGTIPEFDRLYRITLNEGQSEKDAVADYNNNPDVEYAQLNYIFKGASTPNDPLYPLQWSLHSTGQMYPESMRYNTPPAVYDIDIDAPEAWSLSTGSSDIIVAVVDTGVDYNHRDLAENMWINSLEDHEPIGEIGPEDFDGIDDDGNGLVDDICGYDFCDVGQVRDSDPDDDRGHGTHCAGTIAAVGNNGLDMAGVSWNAKIMAVKVSSWQDSFTTANVVDGLYYAISKGARVISNSYYTGESPALTEVVNYAYSQNIVMVACAGNDNSQTPRVPAVMENVIAVAALNSQNEKATFSNYGNWVEIAAPGVDILSLRAANGVIGCHYDDFTTILSGTSMACPSVAGVCAVILGEYPELTPDEVLAVLQNTSDPLNDQTICQAGKVNLFNALYSLNTSKGVISLDNWVYAADDVITITLQDYDLSGNEIVYIQSSIGDLEAVSLTETEVGSKCFKANIDIALGDPVFANNILEVSNSNAITLTYYDADDGFGQASTVTDIAFIDSEAPYMSNLLVTPTGMQPYINLETNEPAFVRVYYDYDCSGSFEEGTFSYGTVHELVMDIDYENTEYYYIIEVEDDAGNIQSYDNNGSCYSFISDDAGIIEVPTQYSLIQRAIDASWNGGVVRILPGTYNESISIKGKSITIKSVEPSNDNIVNSTVITSFLYGPLVKCNSGESYNTVIDGVTFENPWHYAHKGIEYIDCSVLCVDSSPVIKNCNFVGKGLSYSGDLILENCSGIYVLNSANPVVRNCTFSGHHYAIRSYSSDSSISLESCVLFNNINGVVTNGNTEVFGCTIVDNNTGVYAYDNTNVTISNCIIWNNIEDDLYNCEALYSCISDIEDLGDQEVTNNISDNPMFCDSVSYDFRIQEGSPCIDAGDPDYFMLNEEVDLEGQMRVMNGNEEIQPCIDIGADEWHPWNNSTQCYGDGDGDGDVDLNDLAMLRYYFASSYFPNDSYTGIYDPCVDFDRNGLVNLADQVVLNQYFGSVISSGCSWDCSWPPVLP